MSEQRNKIGHLTVRLGPMCAGKTSHACQEASTLSVLGLRVAYINHNIDNDRTTLGGCPGKFHCHNPSNIFLDSNVETLISSTLSSLNLELYEAIVIDESQFFDDLVETVNKLVNDGKIVQVYGLAATFDRKKFGHTIELIPNADVFEQMTAKCVVCLKDKDLGFQPASFTMKTIDGAEVIVAGGLEKYLAVCRKHHHIN